MSIYNICVYVPAHPFMGINMNVGCHGDCVDVRGSLRYWSSPSTLSEVVSLGFFSYCVCQAQWPGSFLRSFCLCLPSFWNYLLKSGFSWVLEIQTQVLVTARQALVPGDHLSSPILLFRQSSNKIQARAILCVL